MSKKLICLLLTVVMLFTLAVGCDNKEEPPQPVSSNPEVKEEGEKPDEKPDDKYGGTLVVGATEMSGNFNPQYYSSAYDGYVVDLVFQQLVTLNTEGIYEPTVAKDYEFSEDGKSITFKIREDIVFSDGEPLTAEDVEFTFLGIADPSYTGRNGEVVADMVGYDEYANGETDVFKGLEVIDKYTIKINFKDPLRVNIKNCAVEILPKHYYGANFKPGDTSGIASITNKPIGSGPYVLDKYVDEQFASLKKNPLYKGEGYYIENIVCKFVEQTTDIQELTSGNIDLLPAVVEIKKVNQAREKDFLTENAYDRSGYGYIKLNCESGPTASMKVRQALYYSFNIKEFVNSYYKDETTGKVTASVQYHPFSQISWIMDEEFNKTLVNYDFDLAKAKDILDEEGWKVGDSGYREKDGEVLELKVAAMPDHDILATLIPMWQRDWGEGLNIKLDIAYMEFNTMLDYVIYDSDAHVNEWSLFFLATTFYTPDPHEAYSMFHSKHIGSGMDNTCRYRNDKIDELFDEGKAITDVEEAKTIYQEICKILNKEAPIMPVYANTSFDLYDKKIKNLKTTPIFNWSKVLKDVYIEE